MKTAAGADFGQLLRAWRDHRRLSQLHLATVASISTRHLSFVETGRSRPSREMVLHLADALEVPYRDRNALLIAAGFAPIFRDVGYDSPELQPLRQVLEVILKGHEPHPALVVDARWNVVAMNDASWMFAEGVAPHLLEPPMNVMRVSLHPDGLAKRIVNLDEFRVHVIQRLKRQADLTADEQIVELLEEVTAYLPSEPDITHAAADAMVLPLRLATDRGILNFISTITTFGAPLDVMPSELAIEAFHPADAETAAALGSPWI